MLVRILLISLYMSSIAYAQVEVKFNAATALLLIPNAGIELPKVTESLVPILASVPLQLLAYHIAVMRGCDVDQPRNLVK